MAWIELHQSLPNHRKTLDAADRLGIEPVHMVGHLACFWLWAIDNSEDGSLRVASARTIARAAQWAGDAEVFVQALCDVNLLDGSPSEGLAIHDWDDYMGKLAAQREANRDRVRRHRAKTTGQASQVAEPRTGNGDVTITSPLRNGNETITSQARNGATVPDQTIVDDEKRAPASEENQEFPSKALVTSLERACEGFTKSQIVSTSDYEVIKGWIEEGVTTDVVQAALPAGLEDFRTRHKGKSHPDHLGWYKVAVGKEMARRKAAQVQPRDSPAPPAEERPVHQSGYTPPGVTYGPVNV